LDRSEVDHDSGGGDGARYDGDRNRMARRDPDERLQHQQSSSILETAGDRERPSHPGVDSMVGAEAGDGEPWPKLLNGLGALGDQLQQALSWLSC
jgi:hypothetical protein